MPRCARCKEEKSEESFDRYKTGFQCYCKPCKAEITKAYAKTPKRKAYMRKLNQRTKPWRRHATYHKDRCERDPGYRERLNAKRREWYKTIGKEGMKKKRARLAVTRAVQSGKLKREKCSNCGSTEAEAHHEDYSKNLEVTWLCHLHHMERHKLLAERMK